jgi:hypothetical protein
MVARIRTKLTYANVVATLALFVALGGVSYAAVELPARSVGTRELKTGAVTSGKVRNGTLRRRDFKSGQVPRGSAGRDGADGAAGASGADGRPGASGAAGPKGERGATGAKGDAGPAATGSPGADGPAGPAGLEGPAGPAGPAGADGDSGAKGPAGATGAAGPQGPGGPIGPQGPAGVVSTAKISGLIVDTAADANAYQFLGPQVTVTTTATQRLTGSAMVPVGVTGAPQTIRLDLCYQQNAAGATVSPFSGGSYALVTVTPTRTAQAVAGTVVPGAGSWHVGACALTAVLLDSNDYVNGYIQVTN